MSGVKGMRERYSTSPAYAEKVRARIRAGGIAKRLEQHVLGTVEMSASQVTAALGLLRKVVPDVASIEHTGAHGGPLEFTAVYYAPDAVQLHPEAVSETDSPGARLRH
jgi:hypothetical protein